MRVPLRFLHPLLAITAALTLSAESCDPVPGTSGARTSGFYGSQETAIGLLYTNHRLGLNCDSRQPPLPKTAPAHSGHRDLARTHSKDLAENYTTLIDKYPQGDQRRGHIDSQGKLPWGVNGRIHTAFPQFSTQAENAFWAQGTPAQTSSAAWTFWFNSPTHRANLDNCALTTHGIGVYYDAVRNWTYYAHDFGG